MAREIPRAPVKMCFGRLADSSEAILPCRALANMISAEKRRGRLVTVEYLKRRSPMQPKAEKQKRKLDADEKKLPIDRREELKGSSHSYSFGPEICEENRGERKRGNRRRFAGIVLAWTILADLGT